MAFGLLVNSLNHQSNFLKNGFKRASQIVSKAPFKFIFLTWNRYVREGAAEAAQGTASYSLYAEGVGWAGACLFLQRLVATVSNVALYHGTESDVGVWRAWFVTSLLCAVGTAAAACAHTRRETGGGDEGMWTAVIGLTLTGPMFGALIALPSNVIGRHAGESNQQGAGFVPRPPRIPPRVRF